MSDPVQDIAPVCTLCGRIYLEGVNGICSACRQASRRSRRSRRYKRRKRARAVKCQCGKPAATVINVRVGREFDGYYTVRMPLCQSCADLERAMWDKQDG